MTEINATRALEMQHELLTFMESPQGLLYLATIACIPNSEASGLQHEQVAMLRNGPTYFVVGDMLALARHAAETIPALPLKPSDLITPSGVCLFDKALALKDLHDKTITLIGFCWHPAQFTDGTTGIVWNFLSDTQDPRDYHMVKQREKGLRFLIRLLPLVIHFEKFGVVPATATETAAGTGCSVDKAKETLTVLRHMPLCLFILMGQTITSTTTEKPQRSTRRRLARAKSPLKDFSVKVVRLRRLKTRLPTGETKTVEWSHRWVVNGHWRIQPTKNGPKRIWIMPFIKGAADLPLKLKETIYILER